MKTEPNETPTICAECGERDAWQLRRGMCPMSDDGEGPHRPVRDERFSPELIDVYLRSRAYAEDARYDVE